jgi:hypothetical protein
MTTVDIEVEKRHLAPPYLLKLDTHGAEVAILERARSVLKRASLLLIESYNFELSETSLRFNEMCAHLEAQGFRCVDLCEPLFRPSDQALWQIDLFFAPASERLFQQNTYA